MAVQAGRPTDHANINLLELNRDIIRRRAGKQVIWQPRILCWYDDRMFTGAGLPAPYTGMTSPQMYQALGCSNRIYDYNGCFRKIDDARVRHESRKISALETEHIIETPVGTVNMRLVANTSNYGTFPKKWWITEEADMRVFMWMEEHCSWKWDQAHFDRTYAEWGNLGLPAVFLPRTNIQSLFLDTMGVENGIYALYDWPDLVEAYFRILDDSHRRLIEVVNASPIEYINFGDNLHGGILPPDLFRKYLLPAYQNRNDQLHSAGKFTFSHWDGDVKPLLQFARSCGLDGIEAITPLPQGDVTVEEMKAALGDDIFLIDGIAAILFDESWPEKMLIDQTDQLLNLFAGQLILGISDEMSSTGSIERVKLVGQIVDDWNAAH